MPLFLLQVWRKHIQWFDSPCCKAQGRDLMLYSGTSLPNLEFRFRKRTVAVYPVTFFSIRCMSYKADIWLPSAGLPWFTSQRVQNSGNEQRYHLLNTLKLQHKIKEKIDSFIGLYFKNILFIISRITFSTHAALLIMDKFMLQEKTRKSLP